MHIDSLLTAGYVPVIYPSELRESVIRSTKSWERFSALSVETKSLLSKGERQKDFGYMLRIGEGEDPKELFHLLGDTVEELRSMAEAIPDRSAIEFIESGDTLIQAMTPLIHKFAQQVECRFGLKGFADEVMSCKNRWTFRFLHYFGSPVLAMEHADRGGFTLHNYESSGGGEYLGFDGIWRPWPINETETIIFPGMGLQHRSESKLKALWHRVKSTPETLANGRYAMVSFIDFASKFKPVYRMQDMPEGFNYNMSNEELQKIMAPV